MSVRLIAVGTHNDKLQILDTETGQLHATNELPTVIAGGNAGGYLVGCNLYGLVATCQAQWGKDPHWFVRIQAKTRKVTRGTRSAVYGTFMPVTFGFRDNPTRGTSRWVRQFDCIDLDESCGLKNVELLDAIDAARALLDMCEKRGIKWRANRGALGIQLLKASPYWEKKRRPAPRFINDFSREKLPGNHYGLGARIGRRYKAALYVDQISSHHSIAATTPVPHPHDIRARGHARRVELGKLDNPSEQPSIFRESGIWLRGNRMERFLTSHYGLVAGVASIKTIPQEELHLYPAFMQKPGRRLIYFYTNERAYFKTKYASLDYICAAWTSPIADPVVPEYANWSFAYLDGNTSKQYVKPTLLAAYGTLAKKRPEGKKPLINYYSGEGKGWRRDLPLAGEMREVIWRPRESSHWQNSVTNVIARGVIEAECRIRSLTLARQFHAQGVPVLSVYVDGLILETDRISLLDLPDGWSVQQGLSNVRFLHPNSFTSDEVSKLPGVPREVIERERRAREPHHAFWSKRAAAKRREDLLAAPTAEGAAARDELLPF